MKPRNAAGEMKLAIVPRRRAPIRNCIVPTSTVTASASAMYSGEPTARAAPGSRTARASWRWSAPDDVPARAEQRRDDARNDRGVEAVLRRQAGQRREGDSLRQDEQRAEHAGDRSTRRLARSTRWIHDPKTRAASSFTALDYRARQDR